MVSETDKVSRQSLKEAMFRYLYSSDPIHPGGMVEERIAYPFSPQMQEYQKRAMEALLAREAIRRTITNRRVEIERKKDATVAIFDVESYDNRGGGWDCGVTRSKNRFCPCSFGRICRFRNVWTTTTNTNGEHVAPRAG